MKRFKIYVLFFIFIATSWKTVSGQSFQKTLIFDHFGAAQGYDISQAICIKKAKDGFVWIGTENGLMRFDGHRFRVFGYNPIDSNRLSANYIEKIIEDKHGRLWISASPCLNILDTKTFKNRRIKAVEINDKLKKIEIYCLYYEEQSDRVWIGSNEGLFYSNAKEVQFHKVRMPNGIDRDIFRTIAIDDQGIIWLGGNDGLVRYDAKSEKEESYHRPGYLESKSHDEFQSSFLDKESNVLWLGCFKNGLVKFNIATRAMSIYTFTDPNKTQNGINAIKGSKIEGETHILWLATSAGVMTFDIKKQTFENYNTNDLNDIKGVPGVGFSIEASHKDGIWIGTSKGLHKYDQYKQNVRSHNIPLSDPKSFFPIVNMCVEPKQGKDSVMWFMVPYHSIFKYDLVNKRILQVPNELRLYCKQVNPDALLLDDYNVLWMATNKHGLIGYDLVKKQLIKPSYDTEIKQKPIVLKMVRGENGRIWLGTVSGLYYYDIEQNKVFEQREVSDFLTNSNSSSFTFRMAAAENGKIWIIKIRTYEEEDELYSFNPATLKIHLFKSSKYPKLKVLKSLEGIACIGQNHLVLSSFNGFAHVETFEDSLDIELIYTHKGKLIGTTANLAVDHLGNDWLSNANGILRYDPLSKSMTQFTIFNSGIGPLSLASIAFSDQSRTMYIGQNQAINTIALDNYKVPEAHDIIISNIDIENYNISEIPYSGQMLNLSYNQNNIAMEFTNLCFTDAVNNYYEYSLEEGEDRWRSMSDNTLGFNNLGFGAYTLKVRGKNSFGVGSKKEFTLLITVSPPFWKTKWFMGLVLAVISFLMYSFFKYREFQREKLEKLRHSIARDLHDDMGSSLSHIKMMSEREAIRADGSTAFKIIAAKTSEVMDTMAEIIWSINPQHDTLVSIILKIQEFAIETLEPMQIDLTFNIDEIPPHIKFNTEDRRHFYLIFKEAINNIAKYSRANKVSFSFKYVDKKMISSITDNGLGFNPEVIKKGNGLINMENRAKLLNAKLSVETSEFGTCIALVYF